MFKVTCIIGSTKTNGSTAYLVDAFIKGMGCSVEVKKYCMGTIKINYCYGCKKCYDGGECVQHDDVKNIVLDILSSDCVVIASPSWWADVPAQLKTLFDRTTPYGDTNPDRKYKAEKAIMGIAIAVRAGTREQENQLILNSIQHYYGHLGIETVKRISVCKTDSLKNLLEERQAEIQQVYELGKQIGEIAKNS